MMRPVQFLGEEGETGVKVYEDPNDNLSSVVLICTTRVISETPWEELDSYG
jgi:hypothetical protein